MTDKYIALLIKKLNLYPKGMKKVHQKERIRQGVRITREKALEWLDKRFEGQRKPKESHIHNLAARMNCGRWMDTGQPIVFDYYDRLINGQHTLLAVVESGVTIVATVIWGKDPIAYLHMDEITAVRRAADYLVQFSRGSKAVTAYRWMLDFQKCNLRTSEDGKDFRGFVGIGHWSGTHWDADREAVLAWCFEHEDALEHITGIVAQKEARPVMPPLGLVGGFYLWVYLDSPRLADNFFGRLIDGLDLTRGDPVHTLRTRLLELKARAAKKMGTSIPYYEYAALLIKAWNAFVEGKKLKTLTFSAHRDSWPVRTIRKGRKKAA